MLVQLWSMVQVVREASHLLSIVKLAAAGTPTSILSRFPSKCYSLSLTRSSFLAPVKQQIKPSKSASLEGFPPDRFEQPGRGRSGVGKQE